MKYMPEQQRQQPTVAERYRDAGDEPAAEPQQAATEWSTAPASVGGGPERTSSLARMVSPPPAHSQTRHTHDLAPGSVAVCYVNMRNVRRVRWQDKWAAARIGGPRAAEARLFELPQVLPLWWQPPKGQLW